MQTWYEKYQDQGLMVVSLITETYDRVPPEQEDLQAWAAEYGQTFPVLSDAIDVVERFSDRPGVSLPSHSLIGPGGRVIVADGDVTEEDIVAALEDESG